jgi:hypothetical protein
MQRLSKKSEEKLYGSVYHAVMDARIKIERLNIKDLYIKEQIDKIMFSLNVHAPQSAIDCFIYDKDR